MVKNGGAAVQAWDGAADQIQSAPAREVACVVDSTAAGDSFNAGFLAARMQGATMPESLRCGVDLAAQVITARRALVAPKLNKA